MGPILHRPDQRGPLIQRHLHRQGFQEGAKTTLSREGRYKAAVLKRRQNFWCDATADEDAAMCESF